MKKITKKEFVETLCNNVTAQVVLLGRELNESDKNIIRSLTWESASDEQHKIELLPRTVEKKQTNAVMFSNGSWLYFDEKGEKNYYRCGNVILKEMILTDRYNPNYRCVSVLGYLVK